MQQPHQLISFNENSFLETAFFLANKFDVTQNLRELLVDESTTYAAIQKSNNVYALPGNTKTNLRLDLALAEVLLPKCLKMADLPEVQPFICNLTQRISSHAGQFQQLSSLLNQTQHTGENIVSKLSQGVSQVQTNLQQITNFFQNDNQNTLSAQLSQFPIHEMTQTLGLVHETVTWLGQPKEQEKLFSLAGHVLQQMHPLADHGFKIAQKVEGLQSHLTALVMSGNTTSILEAKTNLTTYLGHEQSKIPEFQQKSLHIQGAMHAVAGILSLSKNDELISFAQDVIKVADIGMTIVNGICDIASGFMKGGLVGGLSSIVGSLGSVLGSIFGIKRSPSPEEIISKQIGQLAEYMVSLGKHIDTRFNHLEKMIVNLTQHMDKRFDHLETMIEQVGKMLGMMHEQMHTRFDRLETILGRMYEQMNHIEKILSDNHKETLECWRGLAWHVNRVQQSIDVISQKMTEGFYRTAISRYETEAELLLEAGLQDKDTIFQKLLICKKTATETACSSDVAGKSDLAYLTERLERNPETPVEVELYINSISEYAHTHGSAPPFKALINPHLWIQASTVFMTGINNNPHIQLFPKQHGKALNEIQKKGIETQKSLLSWRQNATLFTHLFNRYRQSLEGVIDQLENVLWAPGSAQRTQIGEQISYLLPTSHRNWKTVQPASKENITQPLYQYNKQLKSQHILTLDTSALCITALPQGQIAVGKNNDIEIWELESFKKIKVLPGHKNGTYCLALLPDGRLASGGGDGVIQLFDLNTGKIDLLKGHTCYVYSLCVLPNGHLVSGPGAGDYDIRIWNIDTLQCLQMLKGSGNDTYAVVALGGNRFASACADNYIRLWNSNSINPEKTINCSSPVYALALTSNNDLVSSYSNSHIGTWDPVTGSNKKAVNTSYSVNALTIQPGNDIISSSTASTSYALRALHSSSGGIERNYTQTGTISNNQQGLCLLPNGETAMCLSDSTIVFSAFRPHPAAMPLERELKLPHQRELQKHLGHNILPAIVQYYDNVLELQKVLEEYGKISDGLQNHTNLKKAMLELNASRQILEAFISLCFREQYIVDETLQDHLKNTLMGSLHFEHWINQQIAYLKGGAQPKTTLHNLKRSFIYTHLRGTLTERLNQFEQLVLGWVYTIRQQLDLGENPGSGYPLLEHQLNNIHAFNAIHFPDPMKIKAAQLTEKPIQASDVFKEGVAEVAKEAYCFQITRSNPLEIQITCIGKNMQHGVFTSQSIFTQLLNLLENEFYRLGIVGVTIQKQGKGSKIELVVEEGKDKTLDQVECLLIDAAGSKNTKITGANTGFFKPVKATGNNSSETVEKPNEVKEKNRSWQCAIL
jgi:hypothetical protein